MALDGCPTNVNPGQRYFDNRVVHHQLQRFYDAFDGYLADAAQNEKLMTVTVAIESFCGHMDWNAANDLAVRYMIRKAATEKIVFTSAADIAAYHMERRMDLQPAYYFQPDYYYGLHNGRLPGNVGDRIEAVTPEYLAVVRKGNMMPLYFYDYTVPWQNAGFEEIERDIFGLVNPDEHDSAECVPAQVNRSDVRLSSCLEENCLRIYTECEREMKKMVTAVFDLPFSCDCILNANKEDVYIKKVQDSRNGNLHLFIDLGTLAAGSCEIEVRIQGSRTVPVQAEYMKDGFAAMWMKDHAYLRSADRDEAIAIELSAPDEAFLVLENGERIHAQNGKLICHINEEWFNEAPILYGYKKCDLFRKEPGANVFSGNGHSYFRKDGQGESKVFFNYFLDNLEQIKDKGYISVVTGNHDLPRIGLNRDADDLKTVFAFILALPCVPLIYYGDEIGMKYEKIKNKDGGYCRTGSRTPMQWSSGNNAGFSEYGGELYLPIYESYLNINVEDQLRNEESLINEVKKLVSIKRRYPELFACGNDFELISEGYPMIFQRKSGTDSFICAINPSERAYTLDIKPGGVLAASNVMCKASAIIMEPVSYFWMKCPDIPFWPMDKRPQL